MTGARPSLTHVLEGFGLSEYEARAYLALVQHGALLVSEVAYHASIPRTKAYGTLRTLVRKRLAAMGSEKPVRCYAFAPEDTLDSILTERDRRLRVMKRAVLRLKQMREEAQGPSIATEARYHILGPQAVTLRLKELVSSARQRVQAIVDNWGFRLLEDAADQVATAIGGDVRVEILVLWDVDLVRLEHRLPGRIELRFLKQTRGQNLFLFEDATVLMVNSSTGAGLLIQSRDLASLLDTSIWRRLWGRGIAAREVATLAASSSGEEILDLSDSDTLNDLFVRAVAGAVTDPSLLAQIGERFLTLLKDELHISLFNQPLELVLPVLNGLLERALGEAGRVRLDPLTRVLTVEGTNIGSGVAPSVWIFAIAGLLQQNERTMQILYSAPSSNQGPGILQAKINPVRRM